MSEGVLTARQEVHVSRERERQRERERERERDALSDNKDAQAQ